MKMNFQEINQLYELSLLIGQSLDLEKNCDLFLRKLMEIKKFDYSAIWLKNEYLIGKTDKTGATLIYSNPSKNKKSSLSLSNSIFNLTKKKKAFSINDNDSNFHLFECENCCNKGVFLIYSLGQIGLLKLFSNNRSKPYEQSEIDKLVSLIGKFAVSIEACLTYEMSIYEANERIKHERQFESLFDNNPFPMFIYNIETLEIIAVNQTMVEKYGYSMDTLIGKSVKDFIPINSLPHKLLNKTEIENKVEKKREWVHKLKNGKLVNVNVTGKLIEYQNDEACLILIEDISSRKKSQQILLVSERKFRNIFERFPDLYYRSGIDGIIEVISPSVKRLTGYTAEELIGEHVEKVYNNSNDRIHLAKNLIKEGKVEDYELILLKKSGEPRNVSLNAFVVNDEFGNPTGVEGVLRDITDRKRGEEELKNERNIFNNIIDSISDPIFYKTTTQKYLRCNKAFANLHGKTSSQIIGRTDYDLYSKEEADLFVRSDKKIIKDKSVFKNEEWFKSSDNKINYLNTIKLPVFDSKGEVIGIVGISRNITDIKQAEDKLKKLNEKLESAVSSLKSNEQYLKNINKFASSLLKQNSIDEILWELMRIVIKELKFIDCLIYLLDESKTKLIQKAAYGPKSPKGKIIKQPIEIKIGEGIVGTVAKTGKSELINDTTKDNRYIIDDEMRHSELCVPIINDGEIIGVIDSEHPEKNFYTKKDLETLEIISGLVSSRLKNALNQEKLDAANQDLIKLSSAIEQNPVAVTITDINGIIEYVNPAFTKITGYSGYEAIGNTPRILKSGLTNPRHYVELWKNIINGKIWSDEIQNKNKNGDIIDVLLTVAPITDKSGKTIKFIGMIQDITRLKQLEVELIKAKEKAESSSLAKGQFLSKMSHEIRTPMNAVVGIAGLLRDTNLNQIQKDYIEKLRISADNLMGIINDVLDFSKIEAGHLSLENIEFNFNKVIQSIINTLELKAEERNNQLIKSINNDVPPILIGDPVRLKQILLNLVSNAIKFTKDGKVEVLCKLVNHTTDKCIISVIVADTGIGIAPENIENIFNSFQQEDESTTRKYGGTGLGLAITKELIELMDGKIKIESTKGIGSSFILELPFKVSENHKLIEESNNKIEPGKLVGKRVLYAEDNEFNRFIGVSIMEKWDMIIEVASNGLEAYNKIKDETFDIVLMDLQMPEMGGLEATRLIRENVKSDIPIIALTANVIVGVIDECINAGMDDYLPKPFEQEKLYSTIVKNIFKPDKYDIHDNIGVNVNHNFKNNKQLYDLTNLKILSGNNDNQVIELVKRFIDLTPDLLTELEGAIKKTDDEVTLGLIQKLNSSISLVANSEVKEEITQIEELLLMPNTPESINFRIQSFIKISYKLIDQIKTYIS